MEDLLEVRALCIMTVARELSNRPFEIDGASSRVTDKSPPTIALHEERTPVPANILASLPFIYYYNAYHLYKHKCDHRNTLRQPLSVGMTLLSLVPCVCIAGCTSHSHTMKAYLISSSLSRNP